MEYVPYDSSGTDDDLPPSHLNRGARPGSVNGIGRTVIGSIPYSRVPNNMEVQIHQLEQEAYSSVLRAFKAQSDAISWEKESLITELRKELRVSDEEHRELLNRVNADDVIRRIREWRQNIGVQSLAQPDVAAPTPTVSASKKRQKTSQSMHSLSISAPSPVLQSQVAASMQPLSSASKQGAAVGIEGRRLKSYPSSGPNGRDHVAARTISGVLVTAEPISSDPLVGQKVMTRWPEDNNFYEAVIADFNPVKGVHGLVYNIGTNNETWEWVNLKEIAPEDIIWMGEAPCLVRQGVPGNGVRRTVENGNVAPSAGRGVFAPSQNGKATGDVEMHQTEYLIKDVEKLLDASHPDPLEMEKAKKMLLEHEQALIDAIAKLADISDDENGGARQQMHHGQSMIRDRGRSNRGHEKRVTDDDHMVVDGRSVRLI